MPVSPEITGVNLLSLAKPRRGNPLRLAPNLLTFLRIFLVPVLVFEVLERRFELAFVLFVVAACTDAIDGLLARWLRQFTLLGQYLDPVADKLMLSSLFLVLTWMGILEPKIAILVFGRDIGMLLTAVILYRLVHLRDFRPSLLGKANSFSQVIAIGFVLLDLFYPRPWVADARAVMLDATIFFTIVSGFHYALVASRRIGEVTGAAAAGSAESPVPR